jgi:hypothetical protein
MNTALPYRSDKHMRPIISLPLFLVNTYIGLSLALFLISPMFPEARNALWAVAYGAAAMLCFSVGYKQAANLALHSTRPTEAARSLLNAAILSMCLANLIAFLPMLWSAMSYYGFASIFDIAADFGQNYRDKDKFIEELGYNNIGPLYTILNLASFTQVIPYVLFLFCWEKLNIVTIASIIISGLVILFFYISIGTMNGVFYLFIFTGLGWLAKRSHLMYHSGETTQSIKLQIRRILLVMGLLGGLFFVFMVIILSSRLERDINITLPLHYGYDAPIYSLLGRRLGDGFGMALAYISHGWYGLGNSLGMDFAWTEFRSFSRVLNSYVDRFSGIDTNIPPLAYPVRQESLTGYPAFAYWHTIFPWFASDFTFAGTLFIFSGFGAIYGWSWKKTVHEGCVIYASLFSLLTIGALFINANSQILDNKFLTLALIGIILLIPFRKKIIQ